MYHYDIFYFNDKIEDQIIKEGIITRELIQIAEGKETDRLFLQFQPILDVESNRISGFEALVRLRSRKLGMISPNEFIPIAERKKLIIPIGDLIIDGALRFLTKLRETGRTDLTVSINISTIQL
ncbi:MAG TPA: hypothetical protein DIT39_05345 [Tissierellales bacterium]|nr:hypothetical protein [Tissierellales bacterium]